MRIKFFVCIAVLLSSHSLKAQNSKQIEIDSLMKSTFRNGMFNGNILVADSGTIVYKTSFGYSDSSKTTTLTEDYRFHIGSIAKEFNSVGIMMLKEQGKLNLSDKVSQYLPNLPFWANSIRIQDLLGYTSGLPDIKYSTIHTDEDNMNDLKKLVSLNFKPGTKYEYNNNNVFLQRRIIEKVTGVTFKEFVEKKLLKRCGMNHAVVDPTDKDTLVARAFDDNGNQEPLFSPTSGRVAVTITDLYKWTRCIVNYKMISSKSTRFLLIPYSPSKQSGLGINGQMKGSKIIHYFHDGTSIYYQALLDCSPQQRRTVILMTNNKQDNLLEINNEIQKILDRKNR